MVVVWVLLGVLAVLAVGAVLAYNGLIRRRNRTAEAWSQIDVELKRRHDLVPNLVQPSPATPSTSAAPSTP